MFISSFVTDIPFIISLLLFKANFVMGQGRKLGSGKKRKAVVLLDSSEEDEAVEEEEADDGAPAAPSWPVADGDRWTLRGGRVLVKDTSNGSEKVTEWPVVLALDHTSVEGSGAPLHRMLSVRVPAKHPATGQSLVIGLRMVLLRGHPDHARGCHHGKLWLAASESGLRVSIGSQNALPGEFEHGNVAWFRDSPWAPAGAKPEPFAVDLAEYLSRTSQVLRPIADFVRRADFRGVQARLVYSIPGKAVTAPDRDLGGMWMLGRQLRALRSAAPVARRRFAERPFAFFQSGSVGGILNRQWVQHQLFRSIFGNTEAGRGTAAALASQLVDGTSPASTARHTPRLALGFPSIQQYAALALDADFVHYALSFLHIDGRTARSLPSSILHTPLTDDCPLFHAKVMVISDAASSTHFTYCGSHNLSQSAWGSQSKAAHGTCNVNNNEIGVVLPATNAFGGVEGNDLESASLPYHLTAYGEGDQPLCRELLASTAPHLLGAQLR